MLVRHTSMVRVLFQLAVCVHVFLLRLASLLPCFLASLLPCFLAFCIVALPVLGSLSWDLLCLLCYFGILVFARIFCVFAFCTLFCEPVVNNPELFLHLVCDWVSAVRIVTDRTHPLLSQSLS